MYKTWHKICFENVKCILTHACTMNGNKDNKFENMGFHVNTV